MTVKEELFCHELGKFMYTYSKVIRDNLPTQIESTAVKIIEQIKAVVENRQIDDFEAMEQIVSIFYRYGLDDGGRHDF